MERLNGGNISLVIVGTIFLGLQIWWLSMTISNGRNKRILINQNQTDEIKKRLEKTFSKPD